MQSPLPNTTKRKKKKSRGRRKGHLSGDPHISFAPGLAGAAARAGIALSAAPTLDDSKPRCSPFPNIQETWECINILPHQNFGKR
jgi:hypothetical protein